MSNIVYNTKIFLMKRYLIILLIPFIFACGETEEERLLKAKVDSLTEVTGADGQTINEYLKAFNEIQANLDEIKEKERIISTRASGDVELEGSDLENINTDINSIYELMSENKKKLAYLRNKIKTSNSKVGEFKKTIERYTIEMNKKDIDISELKATLEQKNIHIAELEGNLNQLNENFETLQTISKNQDQVISEQDEALNTAYYVIGTKAELKEKGIITQEGGFIGLGGIKKINESSSSFVKIDIRDITELSLNGSGKVLLLTNHPDGSYNYEQDEKDNYNKIKISDISNFWKVSKYLVIVIK